MGDQDCWGIDQSKSFPGGRALLVRFWLADSKSFLLLSYLYNPRIDGIEDFGPSNWAASHWHKDNIGAYPEKAAYIKDLAAWAREWRSKVKSGFEGKPMPDTAKRAAVSPEKRETPNKPDLRSVGTSGFQGWESRPIAVRWEGIGELVAGTLALQQGKRRGQMAMTLPRGDGKCEGTYALAAQRRGTWSVACTNGLTASGTFEAFGTGQGSAGKGTDNKGRSLRFTVGGR